MFSFLKNLNLSISGYQQLREFEPTSHSRVSQIFYVLRDWEVTKGQGDYVAYILGENFSTRPLYMCVNLLDSLILFINF